MGVFASVSSVAPAKAVPEAVRKRPTPQSAPCKAVPERAKNRAPPQPEGTRLEELPTWPGPPSDAPREVDEMGMEDQQHRQDGIDANPPWNARSLPKWRESLKKSEKKNQGGQALGSSGDATGLQ